MILSITALAEMEELELTVVELKLLVVLALLGETVLLVELKLPVESERELDLEFVVIGDELREEL